VFEEALVGLDGFALLILFGGGSGGPSWLVSYEVCLMGSWSR